MSREKQRYARPAPPPGVRASLARLFARPAPEDTIALDPSRIRDIGPEVLDADQRIRVLPAAYWATTTMQERALFGFRNGIYSFPTTELVEHLRTVIDGRRAIEIGAGHGVLAEALGIPATDSRQQEKQPWRSQILAQGQPTVRYGPNVVEYPAHTAIRRFRPEVVIGCWVTHKYNPRRHWAGGNEVGIVEESILENGVTYIVIGNEHVHQHKSIWALPHTITYPDFVYSRSHHIDKREFIATWVPTPR